MYLGPATFATSADEVRHHGHVLLETRRLRLRPFQPDDVAAFESFARSDPYRRFLGDGHPDPAQLVTNNLGVDGSWVIELGDRVVGSIFLGEELACLLDPAVHAMGIGVEAAQAVIADGFERRGYEEIVARADPDNVASLRAMARVGFVPCEDGTYRLQSSDRPTQE
jgi:RimJ/RimL family protein N-acetyltransferase